jgi:hypothetical protein
MILKPKKLSVFPISALYFKPSKFKQGLAWLLAWRLAWRRGRIGSSLQPSSQAEKVHERAFEGLKRPIVESRETLHCSPRIGPAMSTTVLTGI